jgi:hypothetical protein
MFFYGNQGVSNVIISLEMLETAVLLLSDPNAAFNKEGMRYLDYARMIHRVMVTGGKFHITLEHPAGTWRKPFLEAPEPYRTRTENALGFFAENFGQSFRAENVEIIA